MFKSYFLRNILLLSFAAVIVLPLYTFLFLHPSFTQLQVKNIEKEAVRDAAHLSSLLFRQNITLEREMIPGNFSQQIENIKFLFNFVKLKIFSPSGEVIFSTDQTELGTINRERYFHDIVTKGKTYTKVVKKAGKSLENQVMAVETVETYVPILSNGKLRGVFEIYYDISKKKEELDKLISHSTLLVFVVVFILLGAVILSSIKALRSINERERLEKELLKKEKLESLSVLSSGIAHDFNSLMTAISERVSEAKTSLDSPDKVKDQLEEAGRFSTMAKELAQELLSFSKGIMLTKKTAFVEELLKGTCTSALLGKNINCTYETSFNLWPVEVDEKQMSRVFNNIMLNAAQAMPQGGTISIRCKNVTIRKEDALALKEGKYVKISIQDRGAGMPKEQLQSIFDPYFIDDHQKGGLSLASAFSIVRHHNGYITVESQVGRGTTFHIHIPSSQEESTAGEEPEKT